MKWIDAGDERNFVEGEAISVPAGRHMIAVVRTGGAFYAIEDVCSHDGCPLLGGPIEGTEIICPRHGARFSLKTGEALTPPAYEPVRTYETKLEVGRVWVRAG